MKTRIIVHSKDKEFLESGNNPLPQGTNFLTKLFVNLLGKKLAPLFKYDSLKGDIIIKDVYDLKNYGLNVYIIHSPGHTPGSISVIVDREIAIVGDSMFSVFRNSVFPPFADNPISMVDSWSKLINTGCKIFLPSHGTEKTDLLLKSQYQMYKRKYTNLLDIKNKNFYRVRRMIIMSKTARQAYVIPWEEIVLL